MTRSKFAISISAFSLTFLIAAIALISPSMAYADTAAVNGVTYTYYSDGDGVCVEAIQTTSASVQIPTQLGGRYVVGIDLSGYWDDDDYYNDDDDYSDGTYHPGLPTNVTSLDLSRCTQLAYVYCSDNNL